ncbi:hypothetical protein K458DRAFT_422149 [Lentithecium fluviatile CBS 122367]|uniref:Uncharacterized protein n=1 Tax=Lentithecium fluviatile CBS 122367 TaxID=1168545 RepID=A0A6G1INN2_9PLEO|nr:hypothetical protein K458DRAFT_422149 [Lentithecium fluviatile CBS 122367]
MDSRQKDRLSGAGRWHAVLLSTVAQEAAASSLAGRSATSDLIARRGGVLKQPATIVSATSRAHVSTPHPTTRTPLCSS